MLKLVGRVILSAGACTDYSYYNHSNKIVTFNFRSKKRVKTKVLKFIKKEHQETKINEYLNNLGLKLEKVLISKKYVHYNIIDKESE